MRHKSILDTVLLSGWLFADLLLGLMVIFFAAIPGAPPRFIELIVTPNQLDKSQCTGIYGAMQCTVRLTETGFSQGTINWTVSTDMNNSVTFSPASGILNPGRSVTITISNIPCQDGAFIFHNSGNANAIVSQWQCAQIPERLEHNYCRMLINDQNPDKFSSDLQFAKSVLEPQINSQKFLQGRQVGIAIAYGGADLSSIGRGTDMATNAYHVLQDMAGNGPLFQKASYYEPLFTLKYPPNNVIIDVYLVIRPDNAGDTCNADHNPI